jgi:zinc transport system substrate-binding protein
VATLLDKKIIEVPNWTAMDCKNQRLLSWRSGLVVPDTDLAMNLTGKTSAGDDPGVTVPAWDPHSWLDPNNALCYVREINQLLMSIDPDHQAHYQHNTERLIMRVVRLDQRLSTVFANAQAPFLVYHNSFRYLLERYGLQPLAELNPVHDQPPRLRELLEFRGLLKSGQVACLLADLSAPAGQFRAWQRSSGVTILRLDSTGSSLPAGGELYFDLLTNLSGEIATCLASGSANEPQAGSR